MSLALPASRRHSWLVARVVMMTLVLFARLAAWHAIRRSGTTATG